MSYIVAVSGGVDSVVLLDMMAKRCAPNEIIVAHFDHGIRKTSAADARFVNALAAKYAVIYESQREELGENASEATARQRRYVFLRGLAARYDARIVTAHHQDDLAESIAINLTRGTGWRGVAVLSSQDTIRPLLAKRKAELYHYALRHRLEWVEDETNATRRYLRNRIRAKLASHDDKLLQELFRLRQDQVGVQQQIEREVYRFRDSASRYFFTMIPESVAMELLRDKTSGRLTRPQLHSVLMNIKTAKSGSQITAGNGVRIHIGRHDFIVENTS